MRPSLLWGLILLGGLQGALADPFSFHLADRFAPLKFQQPVALVQATDGSGRFFLAEQGGRILTFKEGDPEAKVFLDLRGKVRQVHAEEGLLSIALHPHFAQNGQVFVYYIADHPHREVLARFTRDRAHPGQADPRSQKVLLQVPKKYGNHNGACLLFGRDGYLYFGLGDGGGAGDPDRHAQDLKSLWGKILRVDVDHPRDGRAYGIPKDNPFSTKSGARGEIWAYGFRNPWRMSFDRDTGELWVGDVGQDRWEEVDVVHRGCNYGWNLMEGIHPFRPLGNGVVPGLVAPILDYPHKPEDLDRPVSYIGSCVTGGYVYRGDLVPPLQGAYLFADYVLGWVRALWRAPNGKLRDSLVLEQADNLSSFAEDQRGEIYLLGYATGRVYRLEMAKDP